MKLTIFLLTALLLEVSAHSVAQKVDFTGNDVALEKVFSEVEKQTGYYFLYTKDALKKGQKVSISVQDMPLTDFLDKILANQPLVYTIASKTVTISPTTPVHFSLDHGLNASMIPMITISGIILSMDGVGIPGASIAIKGSKKGTSADTDGRFSLTGISEEDIIEISAVGFSKLTVKVIKNSLVIVSEDGKMTEQLSSGRLDNVVIRLTKSNLALDETIVIAYGTTTKRLNTGNVSTLKAEEIAKMPVVNLQQALQGRIPGLEISFLNGNTAAPVKMEIRGRNSLNPNVLSEPLYVIDDVPYNVLNVNKIGALTGSGNAPETSNGMAQAGWSNTNGHNILSFINPKDIESIEVLKDADATAIYGSRGANGVVMIRTKRGQSGPTRFSIDLSQGTTLTSRPLGLLSTAEYLEVRKEAFRNTGIIPTEESAIDLMVWDQNRYTDWQKVLYGTGSQTQVSASVSGGLSQTTYGITASYRSTKELMNNNGRNAGANLLMSIDHRSPNQKFNVGLQSVMSLEHSNNFMINGGATVAPNAPAIYDETGEFNFAEWQAGSTNHFPFRGLKMGNEEQIHTLVNSLNIGYQAFKGFTVSAVAGYSFATNLSQRFEPLAASPPDNPFASSSAFYGNTSNSLWSFEPQLRYTTFIGRGSLSTMVVGTLNYNNTRGITSFGQGYPDDNLLNSINNAGFQYVLEGYAESKTTSLSARINYNWANKYIINLNGRRDGSSKFGPGKQFGNFGSLGLAWIISEEAGVKNILPSWVSFVKLRGSYGSVGGSAAGDYLYLSRWSITSDGFTKIPKYGDIQSILSTQPVNQQFQWETSLKAEIGLELNLLEDRISTSASFYRNRSGNQLTEIPTPGYTGFRAIVANLDALVQNQGFEFFATAKLIEQKDFFLAARFNYSINRNKLLAYPNIESSPFAGRYQVGKSLGSRYYLHYIGIDPVRGNPIFEDRNKDGTVSAYVPFIPGDPESDYYVPIDRTPKYSGGFGFQVAYKNFDLDMFFMYRKQIGQNPFTTLIAGSMQNIILPDEIKNNHWQKPGDIALYPRYTTFENSPILESDGAFTDASFVKLSSLSLSYELPLKLISKVNIKSCRIALQTSNLFYITSYKGPNPEVQSFERVSPIPRLISSSLILNF